MLDNLEEQGGSAELEDWAKSNEHFPEIDGFEQQCDPSMPS
jgi:hypothetical protein